MADICAPLQVYVVLAIISVITYMINMYSSVHVVETQNPSDLYLKTVSTQHGYMALVIKIVFIILFGYLLQVLCDNKLADVAWIVMFFPFILFLFVALYAMSIGAIMAVRGKTGLLSGSSGFRVGAGAHDKERHAFKVGAGAHDKHSFRVGAGAHDKHY